MIGAILGTDKSSIVSQSWDYLRHYDSVFHPFRDDDINVIEVGVAGGHSLRLWQWYFSAARIIGVDIMPTAKRYAGGRATVEIGSQADVFFLRKLCKKYPPTIFIDDGSHLAQHNIITFEAVFPNLLAGGLYVVEDMALHLGTAAAAWQTDVPRDSPAYFLDLARSCLARHHMEGAERVPKHLIGMVDSVSFINSAAIIRKRGARAGLDEAIGEGASYLAAMKPAAEAYDRLALYVARHGVRCGRWRQRAKRRSRPAAAPCRSGAFTPIPCCAPAASGTRRRRYQRRWRCRIRRSAVRPLRCCPRPA
jgi:hypothetical protein